MNYSLIIVEGYTDAEVLGRILISNKFKLLTSKKEIDEKWISLIPTQFPVGDNLLERVNVPFFYIKDESSIAIKIGGGIENMPKVYKTIRDVSFNNFRGINNVFIVIDADNNDETPLRKRYVEMLDFPSIGKGVTKNGGVNYGLFIIPNNNDIGTIEKYLIQCGEIKYRDLIDKTKVLLDSIDKSKLNPKDIEEYQKPFGREKALVGIVANVLKPGKSIGASIHDNRWIEEDSIKSTEIQELEKYIIPII
jgi:hypothetical protein